MALAVPGFVVYTSFAFWTGPGFKSLFASEWYPHAGRYGLLPAIVGSAWTLFLALAVAVPTGLAAAVVSAELLPSRWRLPVRIGLELAAAVPAVVYGLIGLWVLLPALAQLFDLPTGHSLLAAGLLLAWMILPTLVTLGEDALRAVPAEQREAAQALGLGWPALLFRVVLVQAWPGIRGAILLALGRVLGETLAVMLVVGSLDRLPKPWWNPLQPAQTLTSRIGREIGEVAFGSLHFAALMACALLLGLAGSGIAWLAHRRERQ
nr:phosphate transport system permease protein [uncultured Gammaproteobacteria bacterium]BAL54495.1 phosphate transport system permease protein [uncultured Gammaproteobacteria bacterium]